MFQQQGPFQKELIFNRYVGWGNLDGAFQVQLLVKHVLKHYSPNEIIILVHALAGARPTSLEFDISVTRLPEVFMQYLHTVVYKL